MEDRRNRDAGPMCLSDELMHVSDKQMIRGDGEADESLKKKMISQKHNKQTDDGTQLPGAHALQPPVDEDEQ